LAETNSTSTRSNDGALPEPKRSPAARTCARPSTYQASLRNRFRNPGPATSTRSSDAPSPAVSSSANRPATSRGLAFITGASIIAALVA